MTPMYVRSLSQVLGMLTATVAHAAVALLPARART